MVNVCAIVNIPKMLTNIKKSEGKEKVDEHELGKKYSTSHFSFYIVISY